MSARNRHGIAATLAAVAAVGLLAAGCGQSTAGSAAPGSAPASTAQSAPAPASAPATTTSGAAQPATGSATCDFQATPGQPAPAGHDVGRPPASATRQGAVTVVLHTTRGDIPLALPRGEAPCTVASFAFLAGKGYFNGSPCHRLTAAPSLKVLQCGDPTGTGSGGPGYTIPDENPTNLADSGQGASVYPRGTVAMANTGQPHSGGSQFFLVYADSQLPPQYAVFGTVGAAGLAVLDKIAAAGVNSSGGDPTDGAPAAAVTITTATATG